MQQGSATDPDLAAPRVVLDTNTVLDWLVFADPSTARLAAELQSARLRWLACTAMRSELAAVLKSPALRARAAFEPDAVLAHFDALTQRVADPPTQRPLRARDADDQVFIDLAIAHHAAWLFTRDKALLALARSAWQRHGLMVGTAARWATG